MSSGAIVFLLCITAVCFGFAIRSTMKDREYADDLSTTLSSRINDVHMIVFGESGGTSEQQLDALWHFAEENVSDALNSYIKNYQITKTADSYSDFGLCGISKTHFFALLDQTDASEYDDLIEAGNLSGKYNEFLSYVEREKGTIVTYPAKDTIAAYINAALPLYAKLKQTGCKSQAIKVAFDDILYYKIEGSVQYLSNVSGGGVNMQGAVAGAIIGGGAAAIIGSQVGTETRTNVITKDDRKITFYITENNTMETLTISSIDVDKTISALRELIPGKEESVVQIESNKSTNVAAISSADELKKFKDLLDSGVITQEEFDAKKKQLLAL